MKDLFYISKSGEVRWNKFPEISTSPSNNPLYLETQYHRDVQAAKDSSVLCADQLGILQKLWVWRDDPEPILFSEFISESYDTLHPFPSEQYEVEVKCKNTLGFLSCCHSGELRLCIEKLAVIKKSEPVLNEGKGEDFNHPLKSVVDELMKQIEPKSQNYFTKSGEEFHGISWAEIAGIFQKYGYKTNSPF